MSGDAEVGESVDVAEVEQSVADLLNTIKTSKKKSKKKVDVNAVNLDSVAASTTTSAAKTSKASIEEPMDGLYSYKACLDRVYATIYANNPTLVNKQKVVLKPPEVMRVGTSKIMWSNFQTLCQQLNRDPEHVFRFFLAELGTTGSIDGSNRFVIKGKFGPSYISSLLKKYIQEYVVCHSCRQVNTKLERDSITRMYFLYCDSCGASRAVSAIQKGYHATGKGERRAARNAQ